MPSKKVLWGVFRGLNTFLEGIWSPRVHWLMATLFFGVCFVFVLVRHWLHV